MFWWTIASFLAAINTIIFKKVLVFASKHTIASVWIQWMMNVGTLCILIPLFFLFPDSIHIDLSALQNHLLLFFLIGINSLLGIGIGLISQYAYKNEKISILTPFGEVGRIFTIILGFFFLSGTQMSSLVFALAAASILILSSIDLKTFHVNKYCFSLVGVGLIRAINTLIIGFALIRFTPFTLVSLDVSIVSAILFIFLVLSPKFSILIPDKRILPSLFWLISINNIFWLVSYVITLFLMKDLGIVMTSLLGMITLVLTILSSALFFHDRPTRKDTVVAGVIVLCIIGGALL